jgi:predicted secreted protein
MRHQVNEAEDGVVVSARIGDEVDLRLQGLPSGGYRWLADDIPNEILKRLEQDLVLDEHGVGGRSESCFRFRVSAAGRGILRLRYARSWENDVPPLKSFELIVEAE